MARVATSVQGLRQAARFFFAYFEYRRHASTGYVRGHFWPLPFPPPTLSSLSTTTSPPASSPLPRQVYSYNRRRLRPLFAALRLTTSLEPRQQVPRHGAKFILVPLYACSVLATPPRAFIPDASPCLASSDRCFVFIGLDNVFFGIDSYDCLDRITDDSSCVLGSGKTVVCLRPRRAPSSGTTMAAPHPRWLGLHRLRHHHPRRLSLTRLCHHHHGAFFAPAASRVATSIPATLTTTSPRTATPTKVVAPTALGYLDIGTRATTSPELSSASSPVQASAPRHQPRRSRSDLPRGGGGVSLLGLLWFISSLTIHVVHVVHDAPATTAGGVRDIIRHVRVR
jgi:hypothetical protein